MIEWLFTLATLQGSGSDAYHRPKDPEGIYYSISDRGPNVDCSDAPKLLQKDPCPDESAGKIFLDPSFTPTIYKWSWKRGQKEPTLLQAITLKATDGEPLSGISNPHFFPEIPFTSAGNKLAYDPSGLDTEGLVVLDDGTFFVSEEYGPSILHIAADGRIIERWVPKGSEEFYRDMPYPTVAKLPEIFGQRRGNRGFESMALSPDGKHLWVSNQSPLAWPTEKVSKNSQTIRLMSLSLKGEVESISAYRMEDASSFEDGAKTSDLKVSAMLFHGRDLLIEERTDKALKIFRVKKLGKNIKKSPWMKLETSPSLEESEDYGSFADKELVWDSKDADIQLPIKIESVVSWDKDHLLLLNDDDFGVTGESSQGFLLSFP